MENCENCHKESSDVHNVSDGKRTLIICLHCVKVLFPKEYERITWNIRRTKMIEEMNNNRSKFIGDPDEDDEEFEDWFVKITLDRNSNVPAPAVVPEDDPTKDLPF